MRWTIRYQLFVPLLTLLLGVVGISTWTAFASARHAQRQIEQQVQNVVQTLSAADFPLTPHVLEQMKGLSGAEYLLAAADGRRIGTLAVADAEWPTVPAEAADEPSWRLGPRVTIADTSYLCGGLRLSASRAGGGILYILYPYALWQSALWEAVRPSLVLGAFGGLASMVLAVGVARGLSRRIRDLERRTRRIAAGDFSPLPLSGRDDELRDLGQSINDMVGRLEQLQKTMRNSERLRLLGQVSGGLAHQLRNGVAGARLAVQLHAAECHGLADAEALEVALRQLALVEANLKRFLDLGRTEDLRRERCSVGELIEESIGLLRPQCQHAGIELRWQPPAPPLFVRGDPGQLGQLFLNVIGNAVEAAGPGGWVAITARRMEQKAPGLTMAVARVEVTDTGPGPPAEVAGRLFEPFVTGRRDGVGLGLAVARQVIESHGGTIGWHRDDGQTCFQVELPLTL
jgi:signal transduction histidine kinase